MLALVPVEITERGTRVEARTRYPSGDDRRRTGRRNVNVSVAYTVAAPEGTRIHRQVHLRKHQRARHPRRTDARDRQRHGPHRQRGPHGERALDLRRHRAVDTKVEGALEAGTISGTVRLRRLTARSLTVNSVSGSVELEDVTADRVGAQSISGDITYGRRSAAQWPLRAHLALRERPPGPPRSHRLPDRGHLLQRVDQHRHPGHDVGRAEWPPQPRLARHRRRRRRLPRPHHLLGHESSSSSVSRRDRRVSRVPRHAAVGISNSYGVAGPTRLWRRSSANPGNHQCSSCRRRWHPCCSGPLKRGPSNVDIIAQVVRNLGASAGLAQARGRDAIKRVAGEYRYEEAVRSGGDRGGWRARTRPTRSRSTKRRTSSRRRQRKQRPRPEIWRSALSGSQRVYPLMASRSRPEPIRSA